MAKHDTRSDADGTSLSTSDRGQPIVTYVRVGRGMVKVTKYEKQDKVAREERKRQHDIADSNSFRSFDSSQPVASSAPSVKSRTSNSANTRTMPAWMAKFKKSKKDKQAATSDPFAAFPTAQVADDVPPVPGAGKRHPSKVAGSAQGPAASQHEYPGANAFASSETLVSTFNERHM